MTLTQERPRTDAPSRPTRVAPRASASVPSPGETGDRRRGWRRFEHHLWIGGVALLAIAASIVPIALAPQREASTRAASQVAPSAQTSAIAAANLTTDVNITASEFKFGPSSFQVPMGQKVTITLNNTGVVEHDVTVSAANLTLLAKPGQTASGAVTFDKPGTFDFFCSIPGHKDAGMKGTLTVVDPSAGATAAQPAAASAHEMAGMAGMDGMAAAAGAQSSPDIRPLPLGLHPLPIPDMAPPITRTQPAYVKYDLTTQKVTALMADGVAYDYWTFNGTVPGPMLRVREGDTVEIDLHNAADAGVTHSIDLHAVSGPGGGARVMQIPPAEDGSFKFEALVPGVYVYHCATPMVAQHIASGMYGLIVVEPRQGLPKVDREFYLMQGDFYLQGQRGDIGVRAFDLNKMLDERPDYVVFNGSTSGVTGDNAFKANVGETVRIFFGVGGPNLTSSFHVIGAIFDRVFPEGSLTSEPETNVQTTHVSAGGATVVEFTPKEPGTYMLVDHSISRMEKGAAGQIVVEGPSNPEIFQSIQAGSGGSGGH